MKLCILICIDKVCSDEQINEYLMIRDNLAYVFIKTYVWRGDSNEHPQYSFFEEMAKINFQLSSLISSNWTLFFCILTECDV